MKSKVKLRLDCPPPDECVVLSDPALLLQYLTNLLSNAAKFTDSGHVMITCYVTPHPTDKGWVDVVLGVADTGPGIPPADQERVLQAFTTGSAVPCEDIGACAVHSTGIGLRLSNLIAQILGEVGAPGGCRISTTDGGGKVGDESSRVETTTVQHSIRITSPLPTRLREKMAGGGGGPGTYLTIKASMELAPPDRIQSAQSRDMVTKTPGILTLEPAGVLRVLVTDDQRTMRQMVSMIFQKFCVDNSSLQVEITTALSGEEAVRLAASRHFHVLTMDETLSVSYCSGVVETQAASRAQALADEPTSAAAAAEPLIVASAAAVLTLDSNRIDTAARRSEFFKEEIHNHLVLPGDGAMEGHEAMRTILAAYKGAGRTDLPIIFNLTGNVMEQDKAKYLAAGSFGVLAKPVKASDVEEMLESKLPSFIARGIAVTDGNGFLTTPDGAFCFTRIKPSCADPDEAVPVFQGSGLSSKPLGEAAVAQAAAEIKAARRAAPPQGGALAGEPLARRSSHGRGGDPVATGGLSALSAGSAGKPESPSGRS